MTALMILLVVVFWIAPTIVGGIIGSHKGRTALGVLLGIILAWIGVIIIAVLSPTADAQRQEALRYGLPCPFCQEPVRHGATVCPHCRRDLPTTPPQAQ